MSKRIPSHYIIVVHGIGEQAYSQTTVEVVHRFAEVRQKQQGMKRIRALLPANLSSQSIRRIGRGYGWAEFRGIPVDPRNEGQEAFDGTPATESAGMNFRFVDLRWADILQAHQENFSSRVEGWTQALLGRLEPPFTAPNWIPPWMNPFLREIESTVIPFKRALTWYRPVVAKMIFDNIIGDIHLYGDYTRTRGRAVRRFHATLDHIHLRDYEQWYHFERTSPDEIYQPPFYTVIAHSLGTVMSFDALTYAYARPEIRQSSIRHVSGSIPFPGYTEEEDDERAAWKMLIQSIQLPASKRSLHNGHTSWEVLQAHYPALTENFPTVPLLLWRDRVKHFITLGSPLDKFHVLWHHNYRHMGLAHHDYQKTWGMHWIDEQITHRIQHYNLCDEQDPVGHHLEITQETKNYKNVFDTSIQLAHRDVVFRRYPVPGAAHTQYWKDQGLFAIVLRSILDSPEEPTSVQSQKASGDYRGTNQFVQPSFHEIPGFYEKALEWAYFRIPLITAIITGLLLSFGVLGWWYTDEFSLAYLTAIVVAICLWMIPRPSQAIKKEITPMETGHDTQSAEEPPMTLEKIGLWERWKPRPSLFANLVRGAITWRRILIWLNQREKQVFTLSEAIEHNVRLSLKTSGGFKRNVKRRVLAGFLWMGVAVGMAILGWARFFDPNFLVPWLPDLLNVLTLVVLITSICYLAVMAYVGIVFRQMKRLSSQGRKPEDMKPNQQEPNPSTI